MAERENPPQPPEEPKEKGNKMTIELLSLGKKIFEFLYWPRESEFFKNKLFQVRGPIQGFDTLGRELQEKVGDELIACINVSIGHSGAGWELNNPQFANDGDDVVVWGTLIDKGKASSGPVKVSVVKGSQGQNLGDQMTAQRELLEDTLAGGLQRGMERFVVTNTALLAQLDLRLDQERQQNSAVLSHLQAQIRQGSDEARQALEAQAEAHMLQIQELRQAQQDALAMNQAMVRVLRESLEQQSLSSQRTDEEIAKKLREAIGALMQQNEKMAQLLEQRNENQTERIEFLITNFNQRAKMLFENFEIIEALSLIGAAETLANIIDEKVGIRQDEILAVMESLSKIRDQLVRLQKGTEVAWIDDIGRSLNEKLLAIQN